MVRKFFYAFKNQKYYEWPGKGLKVGKENYHTEVRVGKRPSSYLIAASAGVKIEVVELKGI